MAVKLRLKRMGKKKQPTYRVVAADSRSPRDGRFIESIGTFRPAADAAGLVLDRARLDYWTSKGALASHTLTRLLKKQPAPAT